VIDLTKGEQKDIDHKEDKNDEEDNDDGLMSVIHKKWSRQAQSCTVVSSLWLHRRPLLLIVLSTIYLLLCLLLRKWLLVLVLR